jgi:hypothetical protein
MGLMRPATALLFVSVASPRVIGSKEYEMASHPFSKSLSRFHTSCGQFSEFKTEVRAAIRGFADKIGRFPPLNQAYSFYVDEPDRERLQIWFGNRSIGRKDCNGRILSEQGPCLVYSLGPTGAVAAIMYPAKSDVCRPHEDCILLRLGTYSWYQLYKKVPWDLKALVAYGHVTSLDGDPTMSERARIWWLRRICPTGIEGAQVDPKIGFGVIRGSLKFILKSSFDAILKPFVLAVFVLALIRFGYPQLANFLHPSSTP